MAVYKTADGKVFQIPNDGEIFTLNTATGNLFVRRGDRLYVIEAQQYPGGPEKLYKDAGVDFRSLPVYDQGILQSLAGAAYQDVGGRGNQQAFTPVNDLSQFKGAKQTGKEEIITETISPQNPQAVDINSNTRGNLLTAPSIQENLQAAGATPEQVAILSAQTTGKPVTNEQLAEAGVTGQPAAQPAGQPAGQPTGQPSQYTVVSGDTLSGIAQSNNMTLQQLLELNPQFSTGGRNPDLIYPGDTVNLGATQPAGQPVAQIPGQPAGEPAVQPAGIPEPPTDLGTQPITQGTLGGAPAPSFAAPTETPTFPVSTLETPEPAPIEAPALTPTQTQAQDLFERLKPLNIALAGRPEYQTQQETKFGVDTAQQAINDLTAQLTGIKNEAAAIPLQLMQGAAERGVTTGLLGAQENSRLRTNAIAALGVSTLLAASRGQLANAQRMADKMVAQKYDPIQAEITALMNNLNLIMNSPQYTLEEKAQAQQQLELQRQRQAALNQARANEQNVMQIATQAAANLTNFRPNAQYQTATLALQAIQNAPNPMQATAIAASVGLTGEQQVKYTTYTEGNELVQYQTDPQTGQIDPNTRQVIRTAPAEPTEPTVLGSASTGYYSYDPATGKTTPIANPNVSPTGQPVSAGKETVYTAPDGTKIDIITVEGIKYLESQGYDNYGELFAYLDTKTKLTDTGIDNLLQQAGISKPISSSKQTKLTDPQMKSIAIALVKKGGFQANTQGAKDVINSGKITVKGKIIYLTPEDQKRIIEIIDEEYPSGKRTFFQSILPGGR